MARVDRVDALALGGLAVCEVPRHAEQAPERLGVVSRVEHDQTHARPDRVGDPRGDVVVDLVVGEVAPPEQHFGGCQNRLRESVFGFVKRRGGRLVARLAEHVREVCVDPVGVQFGDGPVLALVDELVPDCDRNHTASTGGGP